MNTRAQDKRLWLAGGVLAGIIVLAIGWLLVVSPELTDAANNRDQAESARQQNSVLQAKNVKLAELNNDVGAVQASLSVALAELPFDSGLPSFTRQVSAQAAANSVSLGSVVVGAVGEIATTQGGAVVEGTAGLVQLPISILATGPCDGQLGFLSAIQQEGPRRAFVTSVALDPQADADGAGIAGQCTLTLQLTVFAAPMTPDQQAELEKLLSGA